MENYKSFAALIYVTDTEEEAVMRMYDWSEVKFDDDDQIYYKAGDQKNNLLIYAAKQDEMGMTASATLTMKLIDHFRPKYVIMPGIAAGALTESSDDQMYGDVILADLIWNYSNGKYVPKEEASIIFGEIGFLPRPTSVTVDSKLIPYFDKAINSKLNETHVHVGAMASGSAVVANRSILDKQIHATFENTKGLEMEGYGVAYAASHATEPKPYPIIAKSICDFADSRKSDVYQKFAAYTSCEFVKLMIDEILE
ncbi:MAG: hypothetical protein MJ111_01990 [Clostridia bacterium]|nr:hypothetical protein [Clostridia bacterium]